MKMMNNLTFKFIFYSLFVVFIAFNASAQQSNSLTRKLSSETERGIVEGCKDRIKKNPNIHVSDDKISDYCNCILMKVRKRYTQKVEDFYAKRWNREKVLEYYNLMNNLECIPLSEYFKFKPDSSIYSVLFVSKPKITPTAISQQDMFLYGETAELTDSNNRFIEKAEYYKLNLGLELSKLIDKNYAFNFLNEYSTKAGFEYPSFKYDENSPLGKFCEMQAYKTIDVNGSKIPYV
jgi:hypothetical protein